MFKLLSKKDGNILAHNNIFLKKHMEEQLKKKKNRSKMLSLEIGNSQLLVKQSDYLEFLWKI